MYKLNRSRLIAAVATMLVLLVQGQDIDANGKMGDATQEEIDAIFEDCNGLRPGYAVGVVANGELIFAKGYGYANLEDEVPITSRTVFNLASLSKQFTAACAGILIHRGKLSLEDDVASSVPEFPVYEHAVRIKHLIYMTSGLPEYYRQTRSGDRNWYSDYFDVDDAIAASLGRRELEFEPGSQWSYSNINYMLLTKVVASISGVAFSDFARTEIFQPLEMHDTRVNDDLGQLIPRRAQGYNLRDDGSWQREIRRSPHYGGSGVFSTVEDLARWDRSFETHALGGPELTQLLLSRMRFDHDKDNDAFGLVWGDFNGRRTLFYEGGDLGFSSSMVRLLDQRISVIVLSNHGEGRSMRRTIAILDAIFED